MVLVFSGIIIDNKVGVIMEYTINQILEELEELGFYGIVENYVEGGFEYGEANCKDFAADLDRARAESTEEELPDHVYQRAYMLLRKLFGSERERHMMRMSELRQVIRKSILSESYDDEESDYAYEAEGFSEREIKDWVIYEFMSLGFHEEFLEYLINLRDSGKSTWKIYIEDFRNIEARMKQALELEYIEMPEIHDHNHPDRLVKMFCGIIKPSRGDGKLIDLAQEVMGEDSLRSVVDRKQQHRWKYENPRRMSESTLGHAYALRHQKKVPNTRSMYAATMGEHLEPTDTEIRDWVIWELLGMGFHTEFLKYLVQFRDASKREVNDNLGAMLGRMDRARDLDPIDEEPEFGEPNHPATMMRLFVGRIKSSSDQKDYISMAQEQIGDDRLEDIIDSIHQHRVKHSTRTDQLGRPVYY